MVQTRLVAEDPLATIAQVVSRYSGRNDPVSAEELRGGASTRRFFRVRLTEGTAIAMHVPGQSQEIAKVADHGRRWPFLEVRDLLAAHGVRVPTIMHEACADGVLLVEDLGDHTLANYLVEFPEQRELLYRIAVRDLAVAQRALADLPGDCIVRARSFDYDLLLWEVEHFREWGIEAQGIELDERDRTTFDTAADFLARTISGWPRGFVHRDYQSRNLMVTVAPDGPHLTWIDFQDALLGPRVYDLVALLTDSYQRFSREFVEARLDEYAQHLGLSASERRQVGEEFDTITVQRKLKDAGRFVFIDRVNKNPDFLRFVEPTLVKVRAGLNRLTHHRPLAELSVLLDRVLRPVES
ncbi:MAG TPA: phosphotransferase [Polyangiaceae bacterium]